VCVEPICQLNTVGATIEFPSTVTSSAPSGNESTVTSTLGSELAVRFVEEVADVIVAFVVFWGESNQACNGWLAAVSSGATWCVGVL
jgi:hypothetical protein